MHHVGCSQLGADDFVLGLFEGQPGYFVDVGAADGLKLSNTYKLEQQGWTGVALDPLLKNFEGRKCIALKCAVYGTANEEVEFVICSGDENLSGVARDLGCYRDQVLQHSQVIRLRTRLLADILDEIKAPGCIQYLSLDTEGSELNILSTFPFNRYCFGVISVEHNYEEPKRSEIRKLLEERWGYKLAGQVQWDDWYVHSSLVGALGALMQRQQQQQQQ
mmetsp:Transcript_19684/g.42784  ORF Transcript_19684/g.42784 Transcript_19684/m.42784 type:complete len:219 (+) Transcript_19684:173-829(+)